MSPVEKPGERDVGAMTARALELIEGALAEVTQMAIEDIREGLDAGNHVQAAERELRSALRQLVLAERELESRHRMRSRAEAGTDVTARGVPGPGADAARRDGDAEISA